MIAIGIDISKEKIDIWHNNKLTTLSNKEEAIGRFFKSYVGQEVKIVMEATGRYHRLSHKVLSDLNLSVMVINPYQSRHFAKAMNVICKTDKVDARVLCLYAEKMPFKTTKVLSEQEEEMQELVRHLDALKKSKTIYELRLKEVKGFAKESSERMLESLKKEIKVVEKALSSLTQQDKDSKKRNEILCSIPGIGETTSFVMLGLMPELGSLDRNAACALAGLAPMNFDSGKMQGKRHIQKGRHDLRRHLYMPILGAVTKYNPVLKRYYEKLIAAGKPAKVALTACMRKLIVIANGLLQRGELWKAV